MIHQYKNNGYNIVIDGNSGSIHSVDEVAYDIIKLYDEKSENIYEEMAKLHPEVSKVDIDET